MLSSEEFGYSDGDDNQWPKVRDGSKLDKIEIVEKEKRSDC
jgi:hypothetical protein